MRSTLLLFAFSQLLGCSAPPRGESTTPVAAGGTAVANEFASPIENASAPPLPRHPSEGEVPVETAPECRGTLAYRGDAGMCYLHVARVVSVHGHNEVIATDDKGHVLVLTVCSGSWSEVWTTPDGQWLAPTRPAAADPRVAGEEFHAVLAAGGGPTRRGSELLCLGITGAVYGYGRAVHLITRARSGGWQVETIWKGVQQGHWLAVGELDGCNTTDELVCSGFDGDVVLR